jgi:molybdopterin converting factor small subunit
MSTVRYFAAAADLAGRSTDTRDEPDVGSLRHALAKDHPGLGGILDRCAILVDGARVDDSTPLGEDTRVDVLPPFAGG